MKHMKRITSLFMVLGMAMLAMQPITANAYLRDDIKEDVEDAVDDNVSEETQEEVKDAVDAVQDETFDTRQQIVAAGLDKAEEVLDRAEEDLNNSEYASETTVDDCTETITMARESLDEVSQAVDDASDTDELTDARNEAVDWIVDNKSVAKECMVSVYLDGIQAANDGAEESALIAEKTLLPYYKYYNLDTTTFEALIDEVNNELEGEDGTGAVADYEAAVEARDQASLETASQSSAEAVAAAARLYEEAAELDEELANAEEPEEEVNEESDDSEEMNNDEEETNTEDDSMDNL